MSFAGQNAPTTIASAHFVALWMLVKRKTFDAQQLLPSNLRLRLKRIGNCVWVYRRVVSYLAWSPWENRLVSYKPRMNCLLLCERMQNNGIFCRALKMCAYDFHILWSTWNPGDYGSGNFCFGGGKEWNQSKYREKKTKNSIWSKNVNKKHFEQPIEKDCMCGVWQGGHTMQSAKGAKRAYLTITKADFFLFRLLFSLCIIETIVAGLVSIHGSLRVRLGSNVSENTWNDVCIPASVRVTIAIHFRSKCDIARTTLILPLPIVNGYRNTPNRN